MALSRYSFLGPNISGSARQSTTTRSSKNVFHFIAAPLATHLRTELTPAVRINPIELHIIVYTVDTEGYIYIIRIRHKREDWGQSDPLLFPTIKRPI